VLSATKGFGLALYKGVGLALYKGVGLALYKGFGLALYKGRLPLESARPPSRSLAAYMSVSMSVPFSASTHKAREPKEARE
jgi:hypothetical protein